MAVRTFNRKSQSKTFINLKEEEAFKRVRFVAAWLAPIEADLCGVTDSSSPAFKLIVLIRVHNLLNYLVSIVG